MINRTLSRFSCQGCFDCHRGGLKKSFTKIFYRVRFSVGLSRLSAYDTKCMKLTKAQSEDILTFICRVNRSCVDYQFSSMSENQCLTLVCGLKAEADSDIRTRLLARIEERMDVTLEDLAAEFLRIKSLKVDSAMIGTESRERVLAVHGACMQSNQRYH